MSMIYIDGPDGERIPPPPRQQDPQASYQPDMPGLTDSVNTAKAADKKALASGDQKDIDAANNDWNAVAAYMADAYRRAEQSDDPKDAVAALDKTLQSQAPGGRVDAAMYGDSQTAAKAEVLGGKAPDGTTLPGESAAVQNANIQLFTAANNYQQSQTPANATALVSAQIQFQLATLYGDGVNGVYTAAQIDKAVSLVNAQDNPQNDVGTNQFIENVGFTTLYDELQSSPGSLNLTPAEQQLLGVDPTTLTFLMMDGVTLKDPLSPAMLQLAQQNPSLFAYLQINSVNVWVDSHPNANGDGYLPHGQYLHVTVDGKPYVPGSDPHAPTLNDLASIYSSSDGSGGVSGVGNALLPGLATNPGSIPSDSPLVALMGAADASRYQYATTQFQSLMANAPAANSSGATAYIQNTLNPFLTRQLNGFFSSSGPQSARSEFWSAVSSGGNLPSYMTQVLQNAGKPNGINNNVTAEYTSLMGALLKNAAPEEAQGILTWMMGTLDWKASTDTGQALDMSGDMLADFNTAVQIADQQPGLQLTTVNIDGQQVQVGPWGDKVAAWMMDPNGSGGNFLANIDAPEHIAQDITNTQNADLGAAMYSWLQQPGHASIFTGQFVTDMKASVRAALKQNSQALTSKLNSAEYEAFQANSQVYLNARFDQFAHSSTIGVTLPAADTPALRNAIGHALGFQPDQNQGGDGNSVDFYNPNSQQGRVIALDVFWILNQAGSGGTVTLLPYLYASNSAGVEDGVFFQTRTKPSDGKSNTSWIDGLAAVSALEMNPNAYKNPDSVDVKWHYDDFSDFQLNNDLYQGGKIYMLAGNQVTLGADGHVDVVGEASSRSDGWKDFKTTMNYVAGGAGIIGGLILAPFTGGASTALTVAGVSLVAGSVVWNAYSDYSTYADMTNHGEHYGWSNPNARQAIEGDVMTAVQPATLGMNVAGGLLRAGDDATGLMAGARNFASAGLNGLSKGVGTTAAVYGTYQSVQDGVSLIENWSQESWAQRAQIVLNIGINAAALAAGRLQHTDPVDEAAPAAGARGTVEVQVEDPRTGDIVVARIPSRYASVLDAHSNTDGVVTSDSIYQALGLDSEGNILTHWQQPGADLQQPGAARFLLFADSDGSFTLLPVVAGAADPATAGSPDPITGADVVNQPVPAGVGQKRFWNSFGIGAGSNRTAIAPAAQAATLLGLMGGGIYLQDLVHLPWLAYALASPAAAFLSQARSVSTRMAYFFAARDGQKALNLAAQGDGDGAVNALDGMAKRAAFPYGIDTRTPTFQTDLASKRNTLATFADNVSTWNDWTGNAAIDPSRQSEFDVMVDDYNIYVPNEAEVKGNVAAQMPELPLGKGIKLTLSPADAEFLCGDDPAQLVSVVTGYRDFQQNVIGDNPDVATAFEGRLHVEALMAADPGAGLLRLYAVVDAEGAYGNVVDGVDAVLDEWSARSGTANSLEQWRAYHRACALAYTGDGQGATQVLAAAFDGTSGGGMGYLDALRGITLSGQLGESVRTYQSITDVLTVLTPEEDGPAVATINQAYPLRVALDGDPATVEDARLKLYPMRDMESGALLSTADRSVLCPDGGASSDWLAQTLDGYRRTSGDDPNFTSWKLVKDLAARDGPASDLPQRLVDALGAEEGQRTAASMINSNTDGVLESVSVQTALGSTMHISHWWGRLFKWGSLDLAENSGDEALRSFIDSSGMDEFAATGEAVGNEPNAATQVFYQKGLYGRGFFESGQANEAQLRVYLTGRLKRMSNTQRFWTLVAKALGEGRMTQADSSLAGDVVFLEGRQQAAVNTAAFHEGGAAVPAETQDSINWTLSKYALARRRNADQRIADINNVLQNGSLADLIDAAKDESRKAAKSMNTAGDYMTVPSIYRYTVKGIAHFTGQPVDALIDSEHGLYSSPGWVAAQQGAPVKKFYGIPTSPTGLESGVGFAGGKVIARQYNKVLMALGADAPGTLRFRFTQALVFEDGDVAARNRARIRLLISGTVVPLLTVAALVPAVNHVLSAGSGVFKPNSSTGETHPGSGTQTGPGSGPGSSDSGPGRTHGGKGSQPQTDIQYVVVPLDGLNVRTAPATTAPVSGEFHEGTFVESNGTVVSDSSGNQWLQVSGPGGTGWVEGQFLAVHPEGSEDPTGRYDPTLAQAGYKSVVVLDHESLSQIAARSGVDLDSVEGLDGRYILNPNEIFPGDTVYIPTVS